MPIYINPIGEVKSTYDFSYNNLQNYINNKETVKARLEDSKKKYDSNNMQLGIWSFSAAILLLITSAFVMLLDEFNEMLINIGALVIINEFDNMMGRIFLMYLTCFHREITK